jgi:hypothetical protein
LPHVEAAEQADEHWIVLDGDAVFLSEGNDVFRDGHRARWRRRMGRHCGGGAGEAAAEG